jgi:hypothetical protein
MSSTANTAPDVALTAEEIREIVSHMLLSHMDLLALKVKAFGEVGHDASHSNYFIEVVASIKAADLASYGNCKIPIDTPPEEA